MAIPRQRIRMPRGGLTHAAVGLVRGDLWEGGSVERFEHAFAKLVGARHAIATASGRAGLTAILGTLGLADEDEVICPAYGYPVVPHLVRSLGHRLKLVECDPQTYGIDPDALEQAISDRTRAIVVMHLFGVPCRIREIIEIADARGVPVIEDCAHCLGASVGDRHTGTFGRVGYFSFETSKMVNTLGGGMIVTNDDGIDASLRRELGGEARRTMSWLVKRLYKTAFEATVTSPLGFNLAVYPALRFAARNAKDPDRFASGYEADHFTMAGRTGRFTNYQAGLGLRQLDAHPHRLARRVAAAERMLRAIGDAVPMQSPAYDDATANYLFVTGLFPGRSGASSALLRRGIDTKYHYMRDCSRALKSGETFPFAARAESEVLHLPTFPELTAEQAERIGRTVREVCEEQAPDGAPVGGGVRPAQ